MNHPSTHTVSDSEQKRLENVHRLGQSGPGAVSELMSMLTDSSWVVRRAVVDTLGALGQPAVEPLCNLLRTRRDSEARIAATVDALVASSANQVESAVLRLADDPDPAIVADVAQILGRRRAHTTTAVLARLTMHENDNVAVAAIEALGRIGGRAAIEALIQSISTGNFFRIFPAIDVLGRSGDPRVVEPLASLLNKPHYLPEAARALGRSGERAAVKPLIELFKSPSDSVVRIAAVALWELHERYGEKAGSEATLVEDLLKNEMGTEAIRRLTRALSTADTAEAAVICNILGVARNPEAAASLTAMLDADTPVSKSAAEALKRIGKGADASLLQALRDGSSARRKVLLPVVTRTDAAEAVAHCLTDPDAEVRAIACDTLARLGNPSVVRDLFSALADSNVRVVHSATAAIQALGTRETRSLALEAVKSANPVIRRSAVRIMSYFGDDESLQPILESLHDADPRVREAAVQGLPYLEDSRALEALIAETKSSDPRNRALAVRSLGQVPKANERIYSLLLKRLTDADPWVRYYSCQALGRLAYAPAAAEVAKLLHDSAGQVRVSAVEALSHLDSPDAHAALRLAAASNDPDVKRAALVGLGISNRAEDLPIVLSAAGAPDIPTRLTALSAMASFPSPLVLAALSSAAADSDEQVSSAAIGYLASRSEQEATEILVALLSSDRARERAKAALLVPSEGRVAALLVALESATDELAPILISILSRMDRHESRAALLSAMKSNNVPARKAAATGIATRRDPELRTALREAADNDPNQEVREISSILLRG